MDISNRVFWAQVVGIFVIVAGWFGVPIDEAMRVDLVGGLSAAGLFLTMIIAKWRGKPSAPAASQRGFITAPFGGFLLIVVTLGCFLATLPGCASFQANQASEKLLTQYAVMKAIEADKARMPQRAARIREIASAGKSFFDTGTATVPLLRMEIHKRLEPLALSPADRLLADALIDTVVAELQARVGDGLVAPDQLYQVSTVLGWIVDAAELYQ